jgi:predicted ATPase
MSEDIRELAERAEEATEHSGLAGVTVTMAILAVLVAAVSLLGHRAHTEEIILQNKATDQWAYYQAKEIRRRSYELFVDEVSVFALQNGEQASQVKEKYQKEIERYKEEGKDIQAEAKKAENEVLVQQHRADYFDLGEVLLEAALVICSITLLTRKKIFWLAGIVMGLIGVGIGAAGLLIH